MSNLPVILVPVRPDSPCGDDLFENYEGVFHKLMNAGLGVLPESMLVGQVAQSSTPTGVAAWRALEEQLIDLFRQTKHVDMLYLLAFTEAHLNGLTGLAEGIDYTNHLLAKHWRDLHPTDSEADYEYRAECLKKFDTPGFADCLNPLVIADGKQLGKFTLGEWLNAKKGRPDQLNLIEQALLETLKIQPSFYDQLAEQMNELQDSLARLELTVKDNFVSFRLPFKSLKAKLSEIAQLIAAFSEVPVEGAANNAAPQDRASSQPTLGGPDQLQSREDVVKSLAKIILYYSKNEPTSPVPAMLERAQRVAVMNFREIVQEFNLSANPPIQEVLGWKKEDN